MTKRCDINDIRKEFEEEGYTLLTNTYKNAHTKLDYLCPNGHESFTTYSNWHFGRRRCKYCSNQAPVTYADVKEAFEKEGYALLSEAYIKASAKLEYVCPKGTYGKILWNNFQQGHRCQCCYGKNNKLTIEDIKRAFSERGAILIEKEYINSKTKLNYICDNGHKQQIIWDSWKAGHGCAVCAGQKGPTIEHIREEFAKENYILLEDEYKGNKSKLHYKCPIGHLHNVSWGKWLYGRRCPTCAIIKNSGENSHNWKGGISFEPYCPVWKDKEYKKDIKERDGNRCLNPYCSKTDKRLHIHHINYIKKDCSPNNLITLCGSCNSKANYDREWHEFWYKAIIDKRYNRGII